MNEFVEVDQCVFVSVRFVEDFISRHRRNPQALQQSCTTRQIITLNIALDASGWLGYQSCQRLLVIMHGGGSWQGPSCHANE